MKMYNVIIVGAGKIGSLIACLLIDTGEYNLYLADLNFIGTDVNRLLKVYPQIKTICLDIQEQQTIIDYIRNNKINCIISSLPYYLNIHVAKAAKIAQIHYFDLTEDVLVTNTIKSMAVGESTAFVPQCGLAPGMVSILASNIMQEFEQCLHVKLRVGALPQVTSNALLYSLTWSTEGLINQYGNLCYGIEDGKLCTLNPLDDVETIEIDGARYEAFNTSGGIGSLTDTYKNKVVTLNYKTIRYLGHCEKMRFLLYGLNLNKDRTTLKRILENILPTTYQDLVLVYIVVEGINNGVSLEKTYLKKIYPQKIHNLEWSAIQVSTAFGLCAVVDVVLSQPNKYHGLVLQENFCSTSILNNRFGSLYKTIM